MGKQLRQWRRVWHIRSHEQRDRIVAIVPELSYCPHWNTFRKWVEKNGCEPNQTKHTPKRIYEKYLYEFGRDPEIWLIWDKPLYN